MTKIALFGGSFDPPHLGHQLVISYVMGACDVDELWAIPVYKHALGKNLVDFEHRFRMVDRMVSIFNKHVYASRAEENIFLTTRDYVDSRTITLVQHIKKLNPGSELRLIIGSDLVDQAKTWDDWEEIEKIAPPLVVGRIGYGDVPLALPNISSSQIKASVRDGSIRKLVPKAVADYIQKIGLYRDIFEQEFHSRRRMFVYRNFAVHVAPEYDERSHEKWFEDEGWHDAIDKCVRGFWDDRGVYLYIGRHWDMTEVVEACARPIIAELLKTGCPTGLKVFGGMVAGYPGTLWEPRCRLGITT